MKGGEERTEVVGQGAERGERSKLVVQGMRTKRAKDAESFIAY